jgi:hypothetical protein
MQHFTHTDALIAGIRGLVADPDMPESRFYGLAVRYLAALAVLSVTGNESATDRIKTLVDAGHAAAQAAA